MHRRLKSTLTIMNHLSIFAMVAAGLIGVSAIGLAKADEVVTPWSEPDLQGIWTAEFDTPLQRSAKYANQEFFTAIQREELDKQRAAHYSSGDSRRERGTVNDVNGTDNNTVFLTIKHTGARTSLIADPPNGRIPPLTPEAQRAAAADEEFRLALLQSTDTCKNREPACAGGKYDPTPSLRFAESPPGYHTGNLVRINRNDGPEDNALRDRCLNSGLPEFNSFFGSFRRIVQTPGGISMFYDVAHGQGWQRNIVMNGSPTCRPISVNGTATRAAAGRAIRS